MSRTYELAIIADSSVEQSVRDGLVERVGVIVKEGGGTMGESVTWGRRTLVYPIEHHSEGVYSFHRFEAGPEVVAELDRVLAISDGVLRFKIVRLPERAVRAGKAPLLESPTR